MLLLVMICYMELKHLLCAWLRHLLGQMVKEPSLRPLTFPFPWSPLPLPCGGLQLTMG